MDNQVGDDLRQAVAAFVVASADVIGACVADVDAGRQGCDDRISRALLEPALTAAEAGLVVVVAIPEAGPPCVAVAIKRRGAVSRLRAGRCPPALVAALRPVIPQLFAGTTPTRRAALAETEIGEPGGLAVLLTVGELSCFRAELLLVCRDGLVPLHAVEAATLQ